jgi:hypothetical protein
LRQDVAGLRAGAQAARAGHTVLYARTARLLQELQVAHGDGSFKRRLGQLALVQLLVLDDFALTPIAAHERGDLLELLDDRVGSRATIITSQLPPTAWHAWLDEPTLADAILDRVVHCAHKIALKGESMRRSRAAGTAGTAEATVAKDVGSGDCHLRCAQQALPCPPWHRLNRLAHRAVGPSQAPTAAVDKAAEPLIEASHRLRRTAYPPGAARRVDNRYTPRSALIAGTLHYHRRRHSGPHAAACHRVERCPRSTWMLPAIVWNGCPRSVECAWRPSGANEAVFNTRNPASTESALTHKLDCGLGVSRHKELHLPE